MIPPMTMHPTVLAPPPRTGFTTPEPQYTGDTPVTIAQKPIPSTFEARQRAHAAANRARQLYPGPVGDLLYRELQEWADTGWYLGNGLIYRVVEHLMACGATPAPSSA